MRYFILTDLEGVAGNHSFSQTRTEDPVTKEPGMHQLTKEVNACITGIRSADPEAEIAVWDGHGSGGMFGSDVVGATYYPHTEKPFTQIGTYNYLLFVGQHAMAGTPFAPLCHTYSSLHIAYYRLNGIFVGEFGARAFMAGLCGVPTIMVAGDDKAAHEAQILIPSIETAVVKFGKGWEAADSLGSDAACTVVREAAARAVRRKVEIAPLTGISAPYQLEIRHYQPINRAHWEKPGVTVLDNRTVLLTADDLFALPL